MKTVISLTIPKTWQDLPDKELRFVFRLLQGEYPLPKIKTLCLLRWGHLKVVRREGAVFIVRLQKQTFPLSALQISEAVQNLDWLGDFPLNPVRLSRIGRHRPVRADFQNVSFGDFLALDNLYQGFLQTQKAELLRDMAALMYQAPKIHLSKVEEISIFYWYTSLKRYFANMFTHFFRMEQVSANNPTALSFQQLQQNMNTQIRALTGGDITKEKKVLEMDCWRALTELEAKAIDYEELQKNTNS
jgi:hypothetical protein